MSENNSVSSTESNPAPHLHKQQLRRQLRQRRIELDPRQQAAAASAMLHQFLKRPQLRQATQIACYMAADGEIGTEAIIRACWRLGKVVYLPVIQGGKMIFRRYRQGDKLRRSPLGLLEPLPAAATIRPDKLELVLLPLVGFDRRGERLGMGGGYYDRCFARRGRRRNKPLLMGLAHSFQEVRQIPSMPHDRRIDGVITECGGWFRV